MNAENEDDFLQQKFD